MMDPRASITTRIKATPDAEWEDVVQTITVDGDELVYHAEGRAGEVRVNAQEYIATLVELTGWNG